MGRTRISWDPPRPDPGWERHPPSRSRSDPVVMGPTWSTSEMCPRCQVPGLEDPRGRTSWLWPWSGLYDLALCSLDLDDNTGRRKFDPVVVGLVWKTGDSYDIDFLTLLAGYIQQARVDFYEIWVTGRR